MISTSALISIFLIFFSTYFFVNIVHKDVLLQKKQRDLCINQLRAEIFEKENKIKHLTEEKNKKKEALHLLRKQRDLIIDQEKRKFDDFRNDIQSKSSKILEHNRQKFKNNFQSFFDEDLQQKIFEKIGG